MVNITLFGQFIISHQNEELVVPPDDDLQSFLAYLFLHSLPQPISDLFAALWPSESEGEAFYRLNEVMMAANRLLPVGQLRYTQATLQLMLSVSCQVDLLQFAELCQTKYLTLSQVEDGIALYQAPFLPDVKNEWVKRERTHWQAQYEQMLQRGLTLTQHDDAHAEKTGFFLERLLTFHPTQQSLYRSLIRWHLRRGQLQHARTVYERCLTELRKRRILPEAETEQLIAHLPKRSMLNVQMPPPVDPTLFRVYLLGEFQMRQGEMIVDIPQSTLMQTFLGYLCLHPYEMISRAQLVGVLWPDEMEEMGRKHLSRLLWRLQQYLPLDELLLRTPSHLQLNGEMPLWVDVHTFREGITAVNTSLPSQQATIALYKGELLPALEGDWVERERDRIHQLYIDGLNRLLLLNKQQGHYQEALQIINALIAQEPYHEAYRRELMRLYMVRDQPHLAWQQFVAYETLLQQELDIQPDPKTVEIAKAAQYISQRGGKSVLTHVPLGMSKKGKSPIEQAKDQTFSLLAREEERRRLLEQLERVLQQPSYVGHHLVLLEAEAGLGKTRLAQEIANDAKWRGCQVLWGHGHLAKRQQPYVLFHEAFASVLTPRHGQQLAHLLPTAWQQVIGQMVPTLATLLPHWQAPESLKYQEERTRAVEAWEQLFNAYSQITPFLFILEDIHWADEETLRLLPHLLTQLQGQPILFVLTFRSGEAREQTAVWQTLSQLDSLIGRLRLLLAPFDIQTTALFIRQLLGRSSPAELFETRIHWQTKGIPLFILHTLYALYDEGLLYRDGDGEWATPFDETTTDYRELPFVELLEDEIGRRLEQLPTEARLVLEWIAIFGGEVAYQDLAQVVDSPAPTLLAHLHHLTHQGYLLPTDQGYRFEHPYIQQVTYQTMPPSKRWAWHRQVGLLLETSQTEAWGALADQDEQAEAWETAVSYLQRAAQQAQARYAHKAAYDYYERAITLLTHHLPQLDVDLLFEILLARQPTLLAIGDTEQQHQDFAQLHQLVDETPQRAIQVWIHQADFLTHVREYKKAQILIDQVLQHPAITTMPLERWLAYTLLGETHRLQTGFTEAITALKQAKQEWDMLFGKTELEKRWQQRARLNDYYLIWCYRRVGQHPQAQAMAHQFLSDAQTKEERYLLVYAHQLQGTLAIDRGRYEQAQHAFQAAKTYAEELGLKRQTAVLTANLGSAYIHQHAFKLALQAFTEAAQLQQTVGNQYSLALTLYNISITHLRIGQIKQSETVAQKTLKLLQEIDIPDFEIQTHCLLSYLQGEQQAYLAAKTHLQQATVRLADCPWPRIKAAVERAQGLLAHQQGQFEEAKHHFSVAIACHQSEEMPIYSSDTAYVAHCYLQLGNLSLAKKQIAQAYEQLKTYHSNGPEAQVVYYYKYKILQAAQQTDKASATLEKAYQLIETQKEGLTAVEQQQFTQNTPIHQQIIKAYKAYQTHHTPKHLQLLLPHKEAPKRGMLLPEQYTSVHWTTHHPQDQAITSKTQRRRHRLLRLLAEAQHQDALPTIQALATALEVSPRTIKYDIATLRKAGHTILTRGS